MIYGRGEKLFNKNEQQRLIPPPIQQKHRSIRKRYSQQQQETAIPTTTNNFNEIDVVGLIRVVDNPEDLEYYGNLLNMGPNV